MKALKPLAAKGKGNVAVILPDTTSSARYTEFDAPYLTKAFQAAGLTASQYIVQNAQGSDATFSHRRAGRHHQRRHGARSSTREDSGTGAQIEKYAKPARRQGHRLRPPHPRWQPRRTT